MSRRKKRSRWIMGGVATFLVLLLAFVLLLPELINLEPVKERILADISQKVGGQVECERVDFSLLPRPRLVVYQGTITLAEKGTGRFESLTIYPEMLPLFLGKVLPHELRIQAADATIHLPQRNEKR